MRKLLSFVAISALTISIHTTAEKDEQTLVIIGEQIHVEEFEPTCPPKDVTTTAPLLEPACIIMDAAFKAKYRVLDIVEGQYHESEIEFEAYDHYGIPEFSYYEIAMIYLVKEDGNWYHQKYTWNNVYQTTDNEFADCSPHWLDHTPEFKDQYLKPVSFLKPVTYDISHFNENLKEKYYTDPIYLVENDQVTCQKGLYTDDILKIERQ